MVKLTSSRLTSYFFALVLGACVTGCSSSTPKPDEPKELPTKGAKNKYLEGNADEEQLFNNSKRLYSTGLSTIAKDSFESLTTQFPNGAYAEFAQIKLADTLYNSRDFAAAAVEYDKFISDHPSSADAPYVTLRLAQCYQLSSRGVGRDYAPLEKALTAVNKLLTLYPESGYAPMGRKIKVQILESLAAQERFIRDYYASHSATKASEAREKFVATKWEPMIKETAEAKDTISSVRVAYSESPSPQEVSLVAASRMARLSPNGVESSGTASQAEYQIEKALCKDSTVYLYLNKSLPDSLLTSVGTEIPPLEGKISLKLPKTGSGGVSIGCFAENDLTISPDGVVSIESDEKATVFSLDYPPRIALVLKKL